MKIETKEYPEKNLTVVSKITIKYSQENEIEEDADDNLEITIDHLGGGFYYVINTKRWAFNDIDELINVLNDFKSKANIS
jgi:predicted nuclease of restriction endonuclease-like (RecB) superfamily